MLRKLGLYKIKQLDHISPSQYYSAISCPYKLVLANSFDYQPLLPLDPNAYLGDIIHKMIELIYKGIITNEQTFSENWINLINKKEEELKNKGLANITPLKYFVKDFALKKNKVKAILQKRQDKISRFTKPSLSKFYSEKRLENMDKSITGIADLIIESESGATILDFKTGKIYSDLIDVSGKIKQFVKKEYEVQLKLYAHLYFLMNAKYPEALFIVTLSNDFIKVEFEDSDCEKIYSEALHFLNTTNLFIANNNLALIANPTQENCRYCLYRPACSFYSNWLVTNFETMNDLFGVIEKVKFFDNNTLGFQLKTNNTPILVSGLPVENNESIESLIGKNIILYNLKKTKQSLNAIANNFTVIYE